MSTLVYYHPRAEMINLADLEPWLYNEVISLHGQIARSDPPVLTCPRNHAPMYIYRTQPGRYFAKHFPNQNNDGHTHRIATISDEHRRQSEYVERAASDHGLNASLELPTGNGTRLDVGIYGEINTGFEIQRSALSRKAAKTRTAKSFNAGWTCAWVSDQERDPDWADRVPTVRLTTRGWSDGMPRRGSAEAIISHFSRKRVGLNKYRYEREPRAIIVDELAYRIPSGDIVAVRHGKRDLVSLATRDAVDVIDSCTFPGASQWEPVPETPRRKEAAQRYTTACHHPDDDLNTAEVPTQPKRAHRCADCGGALLSPLDRADGICAGCDNKRARATKAREATHRSLGAERAACPVCGEPVPAGIVRHFPDCYYQSLHHGDPSGGA